jgi:hypothetical protein
VSGDEEEKRQFHAEASALWLEEIQRWSHNSDWYGFPDRVEALLEFQKQLMSVSIPPQEKRSLAADFQRRFPARRVKRAAG